MVGIVGNMVLLAGLSIFTPNYVQANRLPRHTPLPKYYLNARTIEQIIQGLGMVYESYEVETEDGYILNLNRMVNPRLKDKRDRGIPVLLINGLNMWSEAWFNQAIPTTNPPVAWLLRGYDIWLGDSRGTFRSQRHRTMSRWWWKYWDFSFHEMGVYDLPAFVDFILRKTRHDKLVYGGISNSAAHFYIMCSERPEYQDKFYGSILFVPSGESPPLSSMAWPKWMHMYNGGILLQSLWTVGVGPYPPLLFTTKWDIYTACSLNPDLFTKFISLTMGSGCKFDKERFCTQLALALGGTSVKTVLHTLQLYNNGGKFAQYNYGHLKNLIKYGQLSPPVYNVTRVKVMVALYYSDIDIWAPSRTVEPFVEKFSGPTYKCETRGVCHIYHLMDPSSGPYIKDSSNILDFMTGRTNSTKVVPQKCQIKRD